MLLCNTQKPQPHAYTDTRWPTLRMSALLNGELEADSNQRADGRTRGLLGKLVKQLTCWLAFHVKIHLRMSKLQQRVKTNESLANIVSRKLQNCTHTNSEHGIIYEHTPYSKSPNTLSARETQLYAVSCIIFACWFATFCYLLVILGVSYLFFPNLCATQPYEAASSSFCSFSRISRQVTCQKKGSTFSVVLPEQNRWQSLDVGRVRRESHWF